MVNIGRREASGHTPGLFLAWFRDDTPAWKTVKDMPKNQGDHWLVGQTVTAGEGLGGLPGTDRVRTQKQLLTLDLPSL